MSGCEAPWIYKLRAIFINASKTSRLLAYMKHPAAPQNQGFLSQFNVFSKCTCKYHASPPSRHDSVLLARLVAVLSSPPHALSAPALRIRSLLVTDAPLCSRCTTLRAWLSSSAASHAAFCVPPRRVNSSMSSCRVRIALLRHSAANEPVG